MKTINKTLKILVVAGAILASSSLMANGASTYKKCTACHGVNGEKVALGKSKVINAMSEKELVDAMKGYQDGTYGGPMKGLMKGQMAKSSDEEINSLASYIVTLKK